MKLIHLLTCSVDFWIKVILVQIEVLMFSRIIWLRAHFISPVIFFLWGKRIWLLWGLNNSVSKVLSRMINDSLLSSVSAQFSSVTQSCLTLCDPINRSMLFNMLSRFVITFLPRGKRLLISWLQSPSAVFLEPPKIKSATIATVSPSICHEVMGPDAVIFVF